MLLDSPLYYGGDTLTVKSDKFYINLVYKDNETNDIYKLIPQTLRKLGLRTSFKLDSIIVDESNRTVLIKNYLTLFKIVSKYYDNKGKSSIGRKKQHISNVELTDIINLHTKKLITTQEAIKRCGLGSRRTFYRRVKKYNMSKLTKRDWNILILMVKKL